MPSPPAGEGVITYYLYSDEGLIGEYDATGNELKTYGYKPDSTWTTDPLFMKQGTDYFFYHNDHLGTPQKLTNISGSVVWSATYDAFGKATVDAGSTIINNHRFPGQYFDNETGLHYNWNRYYEPGTGRYVMEDPIGYAGGDENIYRYVFNNPTNFVDPLGLWSTSAHNAIIDEYGRQAGLFPSDIAAMKSGSRDADSLSYQDPLDSYIHAMSSGKMNKQEACRMMKKFVQSYINLARTEHSFYYLGHGLHAVMDFTSPAHANFREWNLSQASEHGSFSSSIEDKDSLTRDLLQKTIKLMRDAVNGNLQIDCPCY